MLTAAATLWLEARGLDAEIAQRLGVVALTGRSGSECIGFVTTVEGEYRQTKVRPLEVKKFHLKETGVEAAFWNHDVLLDQTLRGQPIVITEGEPDCIAAVQAGFVRAISLPNGTGSPPSVVETIRQHIALDDVVILAIDGDEAGRQMLADLSVNIGKARCKFVAYPDGCKDLNDVLMQHGAERVKEALATARWVKVDGVYRMSDLPPSPRREAHTTGIPCLDPHFKIRRGDMTVVTGVPGDGKSTFVNDVVCRAAVQHGWNIGIASFETDDDDMRRGLREWYNRKPEARQSPAELADADQWIDRHFIFIRPDEDDMANLAWVAEMLKVAVIRHDCRIAVVDPWNELDHDRPGDMSLTEYVGFAIKKLRQLAKKLNIHLIVVAHPTKLETDRDGNVAIPGMYSISDSAHWANKPDVGIVIHRPKRDGSLVMCRIAKSRHHDQIGKPGDVWLNYSPHDRRFTEAASPSDLKVADGKRRRFAS
jgi:twinkle protein